MEKLKLKPITDLLKENFFIPSYQRGYRWKDRQVTNLLDDIWNFSKESENESNEVFYCLQPVVVSKKENKWELIDGQQRLTTIFIILQYLKTQMEAIKKNNYSIFYETRPESKKFLEELSDTNLNRNEENIDFFHICDAYKSVSDWFKDKDGISGIDFLRTLLRSDDRGKNVKVIWYDVSDENTTDKYAIDVFTRLNIGKIPLTNAELIKALFLQKSNFQEDKASLKQIQIASEWDAIEKILQNDAFWFFIYNTENPLKYDNRIEYIFDLMKGKTKDEETYFTFYKFYDDFTNSKNNKNKQADIDGLWLKIKRYFLRFEEWYNNRAFYHLVGFLIECNYDINRLIEESSTKTKVTFEEYLKTEIKTQVNGSSKNKINIEELTYNDKRIRKILLLFNIQTILSTEDTDIRFPFSRYKNEDWDIEHVRSQTDKLIIGVARRDWSLDVLEYFTGEKGVSNSEEKEKQQKAIDGLENKDKVFAEQLLKVLESEQTEDDRFIKLYGEITTYFGEADTPENIDSIANLALLDAATNRSYKNAMFPIKRKTIIENDMNGVFVPICTKNVFLKSYSKKLGEVMYWSKRDADYYLASIKQMLNEYLDN